MSLLSQLKLRSVQIPPSVKSPTGMTFVFEILHLRPKISQKSVRIFTAVRRLISDFSPPIEVTGFPDSGIDKTGINYIQDLFFTVSGSCDDALCFLKLAIL